MRPPCFLRLCEIERKYHMSAEYLEQFSTWARLQFCARQKPVAADECLCTHLNCMQTIFTWFHFSTRSFSLQFMLWPFKYILLSFHLFFASFVVDDETRERFSATTELQMMKDDAIKDKCKHCFAQINLFVFTPLYLTVQQQWRWRRRQQRWKHNHLLINRCGWQGVRRYAPNDREI